LTRKALLRSTAVRDTTNSLQLISFCAHAIDQSINPKQIILGTFSYDYTESNVGRTWQVRGFSIPSNLEYSGSGSNYRCLGAEYFYNSYYGHPSSEEFWPSYLIEGNDQRLMIIKVNKDFTDYKVYHMSSTRTYGATLNAYAASSPENGFFVAG
jgi:hypothetical protein